MLCCRGVVPTVQRAVVLTATQFATYGESFSSTSSTCCSPAVPASAVPAEALATIMMEHPDLQHMQQLLQHWIGASCSLTMSSLATPYYVTHV
jgi:hypothetical protein